MATEDPLPSPSKKIKRKKKISRCKSIVDLLNSLPIVITPTKNIRSSKSTEKSDADSTPCIKPVEPVGKNVGVGPNHPLQNNCESLSPLPWRKCFQTPVKTQFHLFRSEPLDKFMEECPLLLHKKSPEQSWAENVEDWTGSLSGTHSVLPTEPLYI